MASAKQIEANRRNAAGPHKMTDEGKAAIRKNALRHGLAAHTHVLLPGEDASLFNQLKEELQAEYSPTSIQQELLVDQIAESYWRLLRARNMETAGLANVEYDFARQYKLEPIPADGFTRSAQLAISFSRESKMFDKLNRYATTAERSYYRAIRELATLQKQAQKQTAEPQLQPKPQPAAEIRSVPRNPPVAAEHSIVQPESAVSVTDSATRTSEIADPPRAA